MKTFTIEFTEEQLRQIKGAFNPVATFEGPSKMRLICAEAVEIGKAAWDEASKTGRCSE